jgi:8-oxo-dGTP pyrophosphatase MutT (NUDIX family)
VVDEIGDQGLWISGGHVDPGETFEVAAVREAKEELGIDIKLTGLIRVEHSPYLQHGKTGKPFSESRMRVIFKGEPTDPRQPLKSVPDGESNRGLWLSRAEIEACASRGELRGNDFLNFVRYVDDGQPIWPLEIFSRERDPLTYWYAPGSGRDGAAGRGGSGGGGGGGGGAGAASRR